MIDIPIPDDSVELFLEVLKEATTGYLIEASIFDGRRERLVKKASLCTVLIALTEKGQENGTNTEG